MEFETASVALAFAIAGCVGVIYGVKYLVSKAWQRWGEKQ